MPRFTALVSAASTAPVGVPFHDEASFYYLCLFFLVVVLWLTRNLLRSPTGRAWIAIRDSEIAAQSMGVNLAIYKSMAFAYSAALMGVAGALFAAAAAALAWATVSGMSLGPMPAPARNTPGKLLSTGASSASLG